MNIYYVEHSGMWLGGFSIVAAQDVNEAAEIFKAMLEKEKQRDGDLYDKIINGECTFHSFDATSPNAVMIWNGDY